MAKSNLQLEITRFELTNFFGIDLGYLIISNEIAFNLQRGISGWLTDLKLRFDKSENYGFKRPKFDESEYSKTDRVGRNTFSSYFAFNLMPLDFELTNPIVIQEKLFAYEIKSFRIGPKGALSLSIETALRNNNKPARVDILIDLYFRYRTALKNRLHAYINNFIECWNAHIEEFKLKDITFNEIEEYAHYYEIIDFNYRIMPGNKSMNITEIFESSDTQMLKQLAGLSRMSPVFRNYADHKLESFKDSDISNRDDELWVINLERLLRYHPDSKSNIYVDSFFQDVKLGFEILLQQEISLEYLSAWINKKRSDLRIKLSSQFMGDKNKNEREIQTILGEITNLSDIFSGQFIIQRNVKHSFYNAVLTRAFEVLSIENIIKQTKEAFNDLFSIYSAYNSQKISNLSLNFEEANLSLNKSLKKLNVWIVIMTFIMLGFGALQLYIGFNDSGKEDATRTQQEQANVDKTNESTINNESVLSEINETDTLKTNSTQQLNQ